MAVPPCQGSIGEGADNKLHFAPFRAHTDCKDRIGFLEPSHQSDDSTISIKGKGFAVGEVLVGALPRAHRDLTLSRMTGAPPPLELIG